MRRPLLPLLLLCLALAGVGAGLLRMLSRDRAALAEQFSRERLTQLDEATSSVVDALDDVREDLQLAAELASQPGPLEARRRELRALLEAVGQYKAIVVYGPRGEERLRLHDKTASRALVARSPASAALAAVERAAREGPQGAVATSPPIQEGDASGGLRAFAVAIPVDAGEEAEGAPAAPAGTGAVAVLVDTEPLFAPLRLVASDSDTRLLILGTHGQPAAGSEPGLAQAHARLAAGQAPDLPTFATLVSRMGAGERGFQWLPEGEAATLGLDRADAVAVFRPVRPRGGAHWAVALVASTAELRALERGLVVRLSAAGLLAALFLSGFGAYVVVATRRAAALRESLRHAGRLAHLHEKTQKILDNIPTGVLALGAGGRVSAVNQALRARLGERAVGASLADAFPEASPAVTARLQGLLDAALREGTVRSLHGEPLTLFGEEGQYSVHAVPLETQGDAADPEVQALLVVEDLSNLRALEGQLLRAEKLATVGVLAAGIAHEVGTPLGIMRGRAEYVLGKLGPGHPQGPGVAAIVEQADRVSRTLRQLLDLSRLQPAEGRAVDLPALVRGLAELLRAEAERRRVRLEVRVPDALPPLAADPDQLQQVLLNLLLNACDACGPGGRVALTARVTPGEPEGAWGSVTLDVEDDGSGIPPEDRHRIFDPFFTTKKRGQGTGLGLSLVAHVVRNHGGRIDLDSRVGEGTRVSVRWPAAGPPAGAPGPARGEQHAV